MMNKMMTWIAAGVIVIGTFLVSQHSAFAQNAQNDKTISAGLEHSIVIQDGKVWTWGRTTDRQLGYDTDPESYYQDVPAQVPGLQNITHVEAGDSHNLALDADGSLWTWGSNYKGQLGDGSDQERGQPLKVLSQVADFAGGYWHSVAVKEDGTVWTWGYNSNSQLGDGTTEDRYLPVQVEGLTDIIAVDAGFDHTLALRRDGTVWAWGNNHAGQLGDGTFEIRSNPVKVKNLTHVVSIAAGSYHSVALKDDGTVWAWGYNDSGELGDGTQKDRPTPVQTSKLTGIVAISSGGSNSVALRNDGTVWGFGHWSSEFGGNTPFQIKGLTDVVEVATNERHSLAKKNDGSFWAWGWSSYGVLGIPFEEGKFVETPIRVDLDVQHLAGPTEVQKHSPFKDLSTNHWAFENIQWAVDKGIITGYGDATVKPNNNITEAEFLAMLYKTFGEGITFPDTPQGTWYDPYYEFANEYRLSVNKSNANEHLTRGHLAQILVNGLGYDYDVRQSVEYLLSNGFSNGKTAATYEGYEPMGLLTRAEAVTFLRNVVVKGIDTLKPASVRNQNNLGYTDSEHQEGLFIVGPHRILWPDELGADRPYLSDELHNHLQQLTFNIQTDVEINEEDFEATDNGHIPYDSKIAILYLNNELLYDWEHVFAPYYNGTLKGEGLLPLSNLPGREVPQYEKIGFDGDATLAAKNVFRYWNDPRAVLGESFLSLRQQAYETFYNDVSTQQTNPNLLMDCLVAAQKAYLEFFSNPYSEQEVRLLLFASFDS